ncbi:hypothetical protein CFP56_003108 [Quercus suber]|uniref:Uncharacterized protein n=1 Tax=Quercus suber TaxID=58331 RepID=A0AAW0LCY6_QUESU
MGRLMAWQWGGGVVNNIVWIGKVWISSGKVERLNACSQLKDGKQSIQRPCLSFTISKPRSHINSMLQFSKR